MTVTEKMIAALKQMYYYDDLRMDDLCYTPADGEDGVLLLSLGDLAILLLYLGREEKGREAKDRILALQAAIRAGKPLDFQSADGKPLTLGRGADVFSLGILEDREEDYPRILPKESEEDITLNCTTFAGFNDMTLGLVTPMELVHYFYYRELFYSRRLHMDTIDRRKADSDDFGTDRIIGHEPVLRLFLSDKYGYRATSVGRFKLEQFKEFLEKFPAHFGNDINNCSVEDVILFMAHLSREEATAFIERMEILVGETGRGASGLLSSLRPKDDRYTIFFVARDLFPITVIRGMLGSGTRVRKIMEVIAHKQETEGFTLEIQLVDA